MNIQKVYTPVDDPLALEPGTQALIFGATVLYGRYAPGVPVRFST